MARAIWSGSISFGLLNVPVKLYSATSKQTVRFKELREGDGSRIRHKRVAEEDNKEVPYEKIVKAFELTKDRYVPLTKEEMAALAPEKTRAIEVKDFVDLDEIDPIYFDSPYYLGPAEGSEKAYSLLAKAMQETGKVAIARFVLRNKEHLAALRANGGILTLTTMRFADEVVPPDELDDALPRKQPKVDKREVQMAQTLIDQLTTDFDPGAYRDEYREQLLSLIERKAEGEDVLAGATPEEPQATKAPDLMAALEESIAAVKGDGAGDGRATKKPAKKKSKKAASKRKSAKRSSRAKAKSS